MTQFQPGVYTILPKDIIDAPGFGIGPIPLIYPPPDVPVRVLGGPFIENWIIKPGDNNTFFVFAGRGRPDDYKWIVTDQNDLFVSARNPDPVCFRFESAGNGLWKIGLFGQDAILTYNPEAYPELTFKPADGSDAQLFQAVGLGINNSKK